MKYYTMNEAARILNLSPGRVRQMVKYAPEHPQFLDSVVVKTEFGDERRVIPEPALSQMITQRLSRWQNQEVVSEED